MKNKFLLFIISIFCFPAFLSATHIVGGSLTYEQLGGSTYRVTLKVYRDCALGNTAFDNTITIEVLQANGSPFVPSKNISINVGTISTLNPYVDTCVTKPNICVEEAIYTKVVNNLPPFAGGYHLFWQRCCRNASVLNITNPLNSGESFYTYIPDNNLLLNNSSPTWVNSPPTFVCQGSPIYFNHAATDADGDSLVYLFYDPYVGCSNGTVQSPNCPTAYPTFPGNVATFTPVTWNGGGYSATNPLGGAGLTLSPLGILDGIPPALGQYVVGVKCEEWRNGVKIGEILRDFQFNVVSCPPLSVPNFTSSGGCSGTAVTFTNTTTPVSTKYFWDFGDGTTLADTSLLTNPSYTYPTLGSYTVTLISNKGTACADTAIKIVNVSSVTPDFTSNAPGCVGMAVNFTDGSTAPAPSTINNWLWRFGDGTSSSLQNPSHTYSTSGTFTVTLIATSSAGCTDSIKKTVLIQNLPVPNFTSSGLCSGTNITFTNTTAPAANTYFWNFGDGTTLADTSLAISPSYNYPSIGTYTVTLIVNKGTACEITITKVITISYVNTGFIDNGPGCVGTAVSFIDTSTVSSNTTISGWSWNFGDSGTSPLQNPSHTYIASGTYTVTLTVTTASGCTGTATHVVVIQNMPTPNFNYSGTCNSKTVKFTNATIPPGGSYFWDFGNGATLSDTSNATNPSYTYPIIGTYTVTLIVNKGTACELTLQKIIVLSSVTADFTSSTTACANTSISFTDASTVSSNNSITGWNWNFGDSGTSTLQNPTHSYISGGTYNVTLIVTSATGCKDTIVYPIIIENQPIANAGNDTSSCTNNPAINLIGTILNATGGLWVGGGTFTPSDTSLNTTYTPSPTALSNGMDTLLFITTGNGSCPPDTDIVYISFYAGPTASAGGNILVCKDTVSVPVCATITVASGVKWNTLGSGTFLNDSILCTSYIPSTADTTAGSVIVYITSTGNGNCLAARDSITITFTATPVAVITSNDSACSSDPIPFSVNVTTGSGIWTGGLGTYTLSNTSLTGTYTPTPAEITAGMVQLIFSSTNNGGCRSNADTIDITISEKATVDVGSDILVCRDTAYVPVCATITAASGGKWKTLGTGIFINDSILCTSYIPSNVDTAAGSVIVYIESTGNGYCSAVSDSVTITFSPPTTSLITSNDTACSGDPFPFAVNASTGAGIWSSSGGGTFLPSNTSLTGFYTPSATDITAGFVKLYFMSTNNGGCRSSYDTITVILIPSPVAAFMEVSACPSFPIVFTDGSTSVDPIVTWSWNFGDLSPIDPSQNPSHIYNAGGLYNVSLIVTSINGCVDTLVKPVDVYQKPVANFGVQGTCLNDGTLFSDSSTVIGSSITSWIWTFGDTFNSSLQNPTHTYTAGGNYLITLIVQSAFGCIDTLAKVVNMSPGPIADFIADDYTAEVNQVVNFTDQSISTNTIVSWYWNFGDKSTDSTSTLQNPSHVFLVGGYYDVCLIVTDINGCMDTICKTEIVSLPPDVPKGFTPNNDGKNDIFYVYGGPFKKLKFKIYNNWGELIFESDDQAYGWDGKRDGVDQAIGVYVWTAEATGEDDQEYKLSGDVTLLR